MNSGPGLKFLQSRTVRLGGSALALGLLLTLLPFREVWSAIVHIPPTLGLTLLAIYVTLHLIGVLKWRLMINLAGADLSFPGAVRCYYAGLFANQFLPSLVGGDVVRAGMAFRFSRSRAGVVLGSLIDRIGDVIGLAAVAATGTLSIPASLDPQNRRIFWAVGGILTAMGALAAFGVFALPGRRFPFKIRRVMVKLRRGIRSTRANPGILAFCILSGMVLQTSQVAINYLLGEASGLHLPFGVWLFAWPLAKLSALLPLTQGGIGVREAALVGLLLPFGAPAALTVAAGLVFEAITIIGGLIGGLIALMMEGPSLAGAKAP